MDDLRGKTAVITGGASGIGRALADAFAAEGMRVVLADVEAPALDKAVGELRDGGHDVTGLVTDVVDPASVHALADAAFATYGAVHVLCNNAGVGPPSANVWETTPNDWRWTFGVNVFGVANGVIEFVPRMLASGEEGIVINTSSPDGPISPMPQASVYAATKSAVTTLTECLDARVTRADEPRPGLAGVPGRRGAGDGPEHTHAALVRLDHERVPVRPVGAVGRRVGRVARERPRSTPPMTVAELREKGIPVQPLDELARLVVDGIRDGRFVIMLDPDGRHASTLRTRLDAVLRNENPTEVHQLGSQ